MNHKPILSQNAKLRIHARLQNVQMEYAPKRHILDPIALHGVNTVNKVGDRVIPPDAIILAFVPIKLTFLNNIMTMADPQINNWTHMQLLV